MITVDGVVKWVEDNFPPHLFTEHFGITYYSVPPDFAALNGLTPEDVEISKEYEEDCLHCRWQAFLKRIKNDNC